MSSCICYPEILQKLTGGIVSLQVLNEVTSVCQRKLKMPWQEIDAVLQALTAWAARIQQCCLTAIASAFE